jgi:hypothetical protein
LQAVTTINGNFRDLSVAAGAPELNGGTPPPPLGIISDNFNGASLNTGLWTFLNPRSDAAATMTGTQLSIAVPSGLVHDCWSGGITAPRVMQPAPNGDFEVEARFDAAMTAGYQIQGILVQQDATNFIRFDFVRDGSATYFFAASFAGDVPTVRINQTIALGAPFYMRIKRVGNQWTGSYSSNGTAWTQAVTFATTLTVSSVGPWAGNAGSPAPAFTSLVNYFFNTASPQLPAKIDQGVTQTADDMALPGEFNLGQNYPNPFNPTTMIAYALPEPADVSLKVYSSLGQEIATLAGGSQAAGEYRVSWNGKNATGTQLSTGVYVYRFIATGVSGKSYVRTRRMLLVK